MPRLPVRRRSGRSPNRRASRSSPNRSRTWKNSGPCGRPSHAARAKRRRPTARRAGTPARPPPEDSRAAEIHVLPPPVAPGARVQAGRGADGTGDMGWQYQHQWWRKELERLGIRHSMSRKGNCLDNAAAEQVFGHLKDESSTAAVCSTRTNSSNASWTPTSSIGTPDDARYDSRDAPRRSSGACPSRSDPVSQLTTSNNRGAVHNRRGLHIDGCIQFVAKESSDACSIIEFVVTRFTMPFMLHDEASGADQRTQTENRTKNRSQRRNEHGSDNADDAGHQQYPEHQF